MTSEEALLFEHIAAMNNQGVTFLSVDRSNALILFRASLEGMHTLLNLYGTEPISVSPKVAPEQQSQPKNVRPMCCQSSPTSSKSPSPPDIPARHGLQDQPVHLLQLTNDQAVTELPSMLDNVFVKAFHLIPTVNAYSSDPLTNLSIAFAIVIFNLAIAFHLEALHEHHQRDCDEWTTTYPATAITLGYCTRAKQLYAKAQCILQKIGVNETVSTGHPVLDLLNMALLNNVAHVSVPLCAYDDARTAIHHLCTFCTTVQPSLHDADTALILAWYVQSFWMHAHFLEIPTVASAA